MGSPILLLLLPTPRLPGEAGGGASLWPRRATGARPHPRGASGPGPALLRGRRLCRAARKEGRAAKRREGKGGAAALLAGAKPCARGFAPLALRPAGTARLARGIAAMAVDRGQNISLRDEFVSNRWRSTSAFRVCSGCFTLRRKFFCILLRFCCRGNSLCPCFTLHVLSWKWSAFPVAFGLPKIPRRVPGRTLADPRPPGPAPQSPLGSAAAVPL